MSREIILKAIHQNKPTSIPLPEIELSQFHEEIDLLEVFKKKVELVGGTIRVLNNESELESEINKIYPNVTSIVSCLENLSIETIPISENSNPIDLKHIDLAVIRGVFGVAENGAVWISEKQFKVRALPFITSHLVIVLHKNNLCMHMHDAYERLSSQKTGYGLFLSGPSKTADIEQCLVIGAQGALSLTIFLV